MGGGEEGRGGGEAGGGEEGHSAKQVNLDRIAEEDGRMGGQDSRRWWEGRGLEIVKRGPSLE